MRHLRATAFVLAAALAVMLLGGLAACGSSEPSEDGSPTAGASAASSPAASATKTYRNDEYGFSMEYPESYELVHFEATMASGATAPILQVGFFNFEGPMLGEEPLEGLAVAVYKLGRRRSPEEVRQMEEGFRGLVDPQLEALENVIVVEPLEAAEIGGVPGFTVSYSHAFEGTELQDLVYLLVEGQHQYELKAQWVASPGHEVDPQLEAAVMSFKVD